MKNNLLGCVNTRGFTSGMLLIASVSLVDVATAQALPKQGAYEVTYSASGTARPVDNIDGMPLVTSEWRLMSTNNAGSGLFHNMAATCVATGLGAGGHEGYCVFVDKDGDKYVETIKRAAGAKVGNGTLGPGTGKYKGIEGKLDYETVTPYPSAGNGSFNAIGKKKGTYKIP